MEKITVTVLSEDFINSTGYFDQQNCPMAFALKRLYPNEFVAVSGNFVYLTTGVFDFDQKEEGLFDEWTEALSKYGHGPANGVEEIKELLSKGGTIEPITVHMTKDKSRKTYDES